MTHDRITRALGYTLVVLTACLAATLFLRPGPGVGAEIAAIFKDAPVH